MSRFVITLFALLLVVADPIQAQHYTEDQLLEMLDEAIAQRQERQQSRETELAVYKKRLRTHSHIPFYNTYEAIYERYDGFNTDSACHYSDLCLKEAIALGDSARIQRSKVYQAKCLAVYGMYEKSKSLLAEVEPELLPEAKLVFYQTKIALYSWECQFSIFPEDNENLETLIGYARDSLIACPDLNPLLRIQQQAAKLESMDMRQANRLLLSVLDTMSINNPETRNLAYSAAYNYMRLGQPDSARYYYAISALSDFHEAVRENASLSQLAVLLFKNDHIYRPYHYVSCALEDAAYSGARLRSVQMAENLPVILEAYQERLALHHAILVGTLVALVMLLIVIGIVAQYFSRNRKRLALANQRIRKYNDELQSSKSELEQALAQVHQVNQALKASDRTKQAYLTKYMTLCSENIAKIEAYRLSLQKTALTSNYAKLLETIKETRVIDLELEDFYLKFDRMFLQLFPTFVSDFNALLRPDQQLPLSEPGRLSTEFRIFALIRLGITDSEEIASFLRYSIKTIYNYRTRIRSRALGDRNALEEKLMEIGMTDD